MSSSLSRGAWIFSWLALAGATQACVGPTADQRNIDGPVFGDNGVDFAPVSTVLERRCGTLDCHGSIYRPLRIYGQFGLRRPEPSGSPNVKDFAQYYSGGGEPTTFAEISDNYNAVLGLEPELTSDVAHRTPVGSAILPCPYTDRTGPYPGNSSTIDPQCLSLVRKPALVEKHKGGKIWDPNNQQGDGCIRKWLINGLSKNDTLIEEYKADCNNELVQNR